MKIYITKYGSPVGNLYLATSDQGLVQINLVSKKNLLQRLTKAVPTAEIIEDDKKNQTAVQQLTEYFKKKRETFDLPLHIIGTTFFQQVWQELGNVPFGQTASYKEIAARIGNPKAVRAVGQANNRNPIPILIPCHRIIGSGGGLTGYGGGLEMKKKLLLHEGSRGEGLFALDGMME